MNPDRETGKSLNLDFEKRGGLIPVIVQDIASGEILMLAYSNKEAYEMTLAKGKATFFSTSRKELWTKGETSGDYLEIQEIRVDCDQDALIYKVKLLGDGVCHTWETKEKHRRSCFFRKVNLKFPQNNLLEFL
ncbi:MAG: phosphoribosyl-AMP cyclohydrolase [Spirochaetes bacterium GWB1_48_6]|nr:MAG: phosphoribosyl-AMP cyclohydrolase [Spirochaetes bacterium GWB1_48_6]